MKHPLMDHANVRYATANLTVEQRKIVAEGLNETMVLVERIATELAGEPTDRGLLALFLALKAMIEIQYGEDAGLDLVESFLAIRAQK